MEAPRVHWASSSTRQTHKIWFSSSRLHKKGCFPIFRFDRSCAGSSFSIEAFLVFFVRFLRMLPFFSSGAARNLFRRQFRSLRAPRALWWSPLKWFSAFKACEVLCLCLFERHKEAFQLLNFSFHFSFAASSRLARHQKRKRKIYEKGHERWCKGQWPHFGEWWWWRCLSS